MKRIRLTVVCLALLPSVHGYAAVKPGLPTQSPVDKAEIAKSYGKLPLAFEENRGQSDEKFDFISRGPNYNVLVSRSEAVIRLSAGKEEGASRDRTIRMRFVNTREGQDGVGAQRLPGNINYFIGADAKKHLTDIPSYAKVSYDDIYPGTDIVYYGNQRQLEYDLVVAPGADPRQVRMAFEGADSLAIDKQGNLILRAGVNDVQLRAPVVYQTVDGKQKKVAGRYVKLGKDEIGFRLAAYDATKPLIIDPVLSYSTYLGGTQNDYGLAIAADAAGYAYVTGYTWSNDFPLAAAYDTRIGRSDTDVFVTKFNLDGSGIVYSTYLGGSTSADYPEGIVLDTAGNAYITGHTSGTDYPTTAGAYQAGSSATGGASFVTKLGAGGSTLDYSTYLLNANARAVAVNGAGNAYVTGDAAPAFVTTPNAYQPVSGNADAFVAKLNANGTGLSYATFLGGTGEDIAYGIGVGPDGSAFVAGSTTSTDFPTVGAFQATQRSQGAYRDAFVTKLDPSGSALTYSTYLGGSMTDVAFALAVDSAGHAYVAGETYSDNFPVKSAFRPTKPGARVLPDIQGVGFVTKLNPLGDSLAYSSFLGGDLYTGSIVDGEIKGDAIYSLAVDTAGHAYVTGIARSYTFPLAGSTSTPINQDYLDALFATKISISGKSILYSTFLRKNSSEVGPVGSTGIPFGAGKGIAVDGASNAYVTSEFYYYTPSDIYATTPGAYQTTPQGIADAVVSKLHDSSSVITLSSSANPATSASSVTLTATVTDPVLENSSVTFLRDGATLGYATVLNGVATLNTSLGAGVHRISALFRSTSATADSGTFYQIVKPALVCN